MKHQADGEAKVKVGDAEAIVFEVRRFTRQEHERGDTADWWRTGAWYRRDSGLEWAWFRQDLPDDGAPKKEQ